ncbi:bone morphogenetic protein 3 [Gracilinanus agilis]|uniref:bone morphogenetic protein 3 n=1 Tax=Gracilinanus agilis TaxID=191870 RepID=UPI001CFE5415|nr:bone morphogenetic protein 3 [Gracilinanus agilis]
MARLSCFIYLWFSWSYASAGAPQGPGKEPRDQVAQHMLRLYDKYRGGDSPAVGEPLEPRHHPHVPLPEGNTVRSFRARGAGTLGNKELHIFNLTSLTKSESILSATLHFSIGELINISLSCISPRGCSHHGYRKQIQIALSAWSLTPDGNQTQFLGHILVNVAKLHRDLLAWQSKDITQILTKAKENGEFFIGIKITFEGHSLSKRMLTNSEPYILVYANDSSISESESVVSSLQGHWNFPTGALDKLNSHMRTALSRKQRKKRSINRPLLPLQNNELPGTEYQYKEDGAWEKRKPYKTLQIQPAEKGKSKKKQRKGSQQKSETLQFDEQTLKKARRKQWIEPRNCARRYLKVDFADIGWSEWIISPKSFDAYYCSGACQFPMPKGLKNFYTISLFLSAGNQTIVPKNSPFLASCKERYGAAFLPLHDASSQICSAFEGLLGKEYGKASRRQKKVCFFPKDCFGVTFNISKKAKYVVNRHRGQLAASRVDTETQTPFQGSLNPPPYTRHPCEMTSYC